MAQDTAQLPEAAVPAPLAQADAASITRLVHGFYGGVRADAALGPVFDAAIAPHWDAHLARMVDFWSTVMLGTRSFRGGDVFGKHMAVQGVQPEHFATWLRLWAEHTQAVFVPELALELQTVAHNIARNLFRGYFGQWPRAT